MESAARHLIFHASVVLTLGLIYGAPYAKAIRRGASSQVVHSWRVAHLSIPIGATLMFAVAAILSSLAVPASLKWSICVSLITSAYAFCISTPLAAITQDRGLAPGAKGLAKLVYLGNILGSVTSLVSALLLTYASFVSL
jgi:glucan phosphoethanolaminetransferase (alkaline phosphatase superfamily)